MILKHTVLLLFCIGFCTYFFSLWNQFVWDDEQFIYRNAYVQDFNVKGILTENTIAGAGETSNYYRPITTLTFAIDHAVWGLNPFGFHLVNVLLHCGAGVFLYLFLRSLLKLADEESGNQLPFWVAVIFLVHPLQTEAVTYINSRGDSLFALCTFAGLYYFAKSLELIQSHQQSHQITTYLCLSVLTYVVGIFSKETGLAAAGLYVITLGFFLVVSKQKLSVLIRTVKNQCLLITVLVMLAISYLVLRATILNFADSFNFYGSNNAYSSSLLIRLLTFSKIIWIYLRLLFFPYPLHMERSTELVTSWLTPWPWLTLALIASVLALCWYEWKQKYTPWILMGSCWLMIMLAPVSGIIPINGLLYEHWLYVPLIGWFLMLFGLIRLLQKTWVHSWLTKHSFYLLSAVTGIYILLTLRQNFIWRSPISFYTYTLQYAQSARLHNNVGMAYADAGQETEAIAHYNLALADTPYPQIYHNLGNAYKQLNQLAEAETAYTQAITLNPNFELSYLPLMQIYAQQQRFDEAALLADKLLAAHPDSIELQLLRGQIAWSQKKVAEAEVYFANALKISGNALQVQNIIANIKKNLVLRLVLATNLILTTSGLATQLNLSSILCIVQKVWPVVVC